MGATHWQAELYRMGEIVDDSSPIRDDQGRAIDDAWSKWGILTLPQQSVMAAGVVGYVRCKDGTFVHEGTVIDVCDAFDVVEQ